MQKYFISLIFILAVTVQTGWTAEIDSVTPRQLQLDNSLTTINWIFNQRLQEGIDKANDRQGDPASAAEDEFCDEDALYTELRKAIFHSFTTFWGFKGYELDKQLRILLKRESYSLSLNDSIYRDINYIEGFSLNIKELSDVVNINGHLIGLDKIGHFFSEGWQYFEFTNEDGQSLNQALAWGKDQESGKYGYSTTGIFSFADLTANFNGWRFWNKILLKQDDPLKGFLANVFNRPYVTCNTQIIDSIKYKKHVKAWELNVKFDLAGYVDGAWDEGNNCNSYADPFIEEKVMRRIKDVSPDFSCPAVPVLCLEAQKKYGDYGKQLLHPSCLLVDEQ